MGQSKKYEIRKFESWHRAKKNSKSIDGLQIPFPLFSVLKYRVYSNRLCSTNIKIIYKL